MPKQNPLQEAKPALISLKILFASHAFFPRSAALYRYAICTGCCCPLSFLSMRRSTACNNNSEYCSSKANVCSSPKLLELGRLAPHLSFIDLAVSCGFISTSLTFGSSSSCFRESNSFFIKENVSVRRVL
uniref:Uncharacterized protein n=1 Tax=Coturnix japonica TaxID=93934 RepID=A0A8C2TUW7_COTJA